MLLSDIAGSATFPRANGDAYVIESHAKDHLVLCIGHLFGHSLAGLEHPNVIAQQPRIFEFKHYRGDHKYWVSKPGVERFVAVPLDRFELDDAKSGGSYIHTRIAGEQVVLSVSGGTHGLGWMDWLTVDVSTYVDLPKKTMRAILDAAWSPDECRRRGVVVPKRDLHDRRLESLSQAFGERTAIASLAFGTRIAFKPNTTVAGRAIETCAVLEVNRRKKVITFSEGGISMRTNYDHIDWPKTCAANGWSTGVPEAFDRIAIPVAAAS